MNIIEAVEPAPSPAMLNALSIVARTAQVVGEPFFPVLARNLAEALNLRWVLICRFDPKAPDLARTIAFWDNGPGENFVYGLEHTPCAKVRDNSVCCFADQIQNRFPKDEMLVDMGAQSYAGIPLRSADGAVLGLIAVLDENPFPDPQAVTDILQLFSGRAAAELERITTASLSERLGKIVEASVSEAYVFDGESYQFELVNRGARRNLGYTMEQMRSLTPWDLKPQYNREEFIAFVAPLKHGETDALRFETVHERADGSHYPVAVSLQYFPEAGGVFFASITDETERKKRAEHEQLLLREVNHRAKNILAVVQVLARQTARRNPDDYIDRLEARLMALSASHDLLVDHSWQDVPFENLIRSQLGHYQPLIGERITLAGPSLKVKASAAQTLGMALHELSTNAAKYGALSNDSGTIAIAWDESMAGDEKMLELSWSERGGPAVTPPEKTGFGSVMIERSLIGQFSCDVDIDYAQEGLSCRFCAPADRVLAEAG
ncbi:sensor histidine kinase [Qipengyuania nanhaisediminis]|uniref:sensor histidine kinase n=1 Tax=Qipengyuania nanhaisediminis TaxID=604088 RepID=UPI0038B2A429